MQAAFGAKIHFYAQRILDVELQADQPEKRSPFPQVHQQVDVAAFLVRALGHRAENTPARG